RPRDILPLARHFLPEGKHFSESAERTLLAHTWPGNVRELRNAVQRAALLSGERIEAQALGLLPVPAAAPAPAANEPDRATIEAALQRAGGVLAQAAAELGLSRQ